MGATLKKSLLNKFFLLATSYLLLATLLVGCGYTFGSLLPSDIKTITIPMFKNSITSESSSSQYHPGVEVDITKEVIERFSSDGTLKVVKGKEARLELLGELTDYLRDPLRYATGAREVSEYRLTLVVKLTLRDLEKDVVMWKETSFTGDTTYFTTGARAKSESSALESAIEDLAKNIVDRTVEGW